MMMRIGMIMSALCIAITFAEPKFAEKFATLSSWTVSTASDWSGEWELGVGSLDYKLDGEQGLVLKSEARRHAISTKLDELIEVGKEDLVLQYEVRLHNNLECGGAYLKALASEGNEEVSLDLFDDKTPYSIMFGPDKCGMTDKVHFIIRHKNPKSGVWTEHHASNMPSIKNDRFTHVYTLILKKDNTYNVLIDGEEKATGSLLSATDMLPPVIPAEMIADKDDIKPEDWVDQAQIPDKDAVKPEDWNEDEPIMIEDEAATKPANWDESAPKQIPDPEATQPEDWSEEDDGEWEAPLIDNPACANGCGPWSKPMKSNPKYKGKWTAPMIDNPEYKGVWQPKQVPNPDYFTTTDVTEGMSSIMGIGFDLWTMQADIEFDNIYIGHDIADAEKFRESTWKVKFDAEKAAKEILAPEETPKVETTGSGIMDSPKIEEFKLLIRPYIEAIMANPYPYAGTFIAGVLAFILYLWKSGGSAAVQLQDEAKTVKKVVETSKKKEGEDDEEEEDDESSEDED